MYSVISFPEFICPDNEFLEDKNNTVYLCISHSHLVHNRSSINVECVKKKKKVNTGD